MVAMPGEISINRHRGENCMFGNLGFGELMIIMIIVLVLFGAKRVPEISASFGKGIREFKRNLNEVEGAVVNAVEAPRYDSRPASVPPVRSYGTPEEEEVRPEPKRLL
jgi:sec-independent protein translocase protein TatA